MRGRRAQASVEYLAVVAIAFAVLIPLALWAGDALARGGAVPRAEAMAQRLAQTADLVAAQGPGAQATLVVEVPPFVDADPNRTLLQGRSVQVSLLLGGQRTDVFALSNANLSGSLPTTPGRHFLSVRMNESAIVTVQEVS